MLQNKHKDHKMVIKMVINFKKSDFGTVFNNIMDRELVNNVIRSMKFTKISV